jgi:hypothetical protein
MPPPELSRRSSPLSDQGLPEQPQDFPHGPLSPPPELLTRLAQDRAKFPPDIYTDAFAEQTLNDWTVDYYFGGRAYCEVLYRPTPQGPEVLAVGHDEILAYTKDLSLDEQRQLGIWSP